MAITNAILKYPFARARSAAYSRWRLPLYLQKAKPYTFEYEGQSFRGRVFTPDRHLYRLMGMPLRFFDGTFSVVVLSKEDYSRYDELCRRPSGGRYTLPMNLVGRDAMGDTLTQLRHSKKAILPEGTSLAVLFHEAMHDVYHRLLSAEEIDDFVSVSVRCFHAANGLKGIKKIFKPSERVFFWRVMDHVSISKEKVVSPEGLLKLKKQRQQHIANLARLGRTTDRASLRDRLDKRNERFFSELFSMGAEEYFGYADFGDGSLSPDLQDFFFRLGLRPSRL